MVRAEADPVDLHLNRLTETLPSQELPIRLVNKILKSEENDVL